MAKAKPATKNTETELRELAERIGKAALDFWKAEGQDTSLLVPDGDIATGLEKLMNSKILDSEILKMVANDDIRVKLAIAAIREFQRRGGLDIDGFLGKRTRSKLNRFNSCDETLRSNESIPSSSPASGPGADHGLLFYYVQPSLRDSEIDGLPAQDLISDAINNWTFKVKLVLREVEEESESNIVMKWDNLGGKGGTLGIAHVGGKGVRQRLTLRLDENEDWTKRTFLNTATHEMGHILGLTHTTASDQMMSEYQNDLIAPTDTDISRLQSIWGKGARA